MRKEREEARVLTGNKVMAGVIAVCAVIMVVLMTVGFIGINQQRQTEELLANTPLKETSYWYSMDNYPKYKVEAAEMVAEYMEDGDNKELACAKAINETSDKIYADTMAFIDANPDLDVDEWEEAYMKYVAKTQK